MTDTTLPVQTIEGSLPTAVDTASVASRSLLAMAMRETFKTRSAQIGLVWISLIAFFAVTSPFIASSFPIVMKVKGGAVSSPMLRFVTGADVLWLVGGLMTLVTLLMRDLTLLKRVGLIAFSVAIVAPGAMWATVIDQHEIFAQGGGPTARYFAIIVVLGAIVTVGVVVLVPLLGKMRRSQWVRIAIPSAVLSCLFVPFPPRPPQNIIYDTYRQMAAAGQLEWSIPTIIPYSPNDRLRDRPEETLNAPMDPSGVHWMGTSVYGEDVLSRMLYACRIALTIGVISTGVSVIIGIVVGGLMGYYAGTVDLISMRLIEIIEAIPQLILLLIVTVSFGRSLYLMMVVIGLISWTSDARFIRAEFLRLRKLDFVRAGVALGLPKMSIIFKHMLPNGISPVLVNSSFGVASAILLESVLSFLGLGLGPDDPSWGQLLEQARSGSTGFNWWIALYPGLAIFLTVFSYILIGEAVRDAIDPKLMKRE